MPFDILVGSMEALVRSMRQVQAAVDETADALTSPGLARGQNAPPGAASGTPMASGLSQPLPEPPTPLAPRTPALQEDKTVYDDNDDNDLGGEDIKRVSYSIWFKKPDYAVLLLDQGYDLVDYPTDGVSFAAIKVADFFKRLNKGQPIPDRWQNNNHPPGDYGYDNTDHPTQYKDIPTDDRKYIQFEYEVTARKEKPDSEYDKSQTRAQEEQAKRQEEMAKALSDLKQLPGILKSIKDQLS